MTKYCHLYVIYDSSLSLTCADNVEKTGESTVLFDNRLQLPYSGVSTLLRDHVGRRGAVRLAPCGHHPHPVTSVAAPQAAQTTQANKHVASGLVIPPCLRRAHTHAWLQHQSRVDLSPLPSPPLQFTTSNDRFSL